MFDKSKKEERRKLHIDFEDTSAIPEIHVRDDEPEIVQREEEEEGDVRIIKEDVAVPEVMKSEKNKES